MARKTIEERIAERQAALGSLEEGAVFEHGPAKFLFIATLSVVVVGHMAALIAMMAMGLH
jgi:hypothetical protein